MPLSKFVELRRCSYLWRIKCAYSFSKSTKEAFYVEREHDIHQTRIISPYHTSIKNIYYCNMTNISLFLQINYHNGYMKPGHSPQYNAWFCTFHDELDNSWHCKISFVYPYAFNLSSFFANTRFVYDKYLVYIINITSCT